MNKILSSVLTALLISVAHGSCAASRQSARVSGTPDATAPATDNGKSLVRSVADSYTPWQKASVKGKMRISGLPVSLNLKTYMVRDSVLLMSMSAPLLGEVGRMEIDTDSILIVNKRAKTYWKQSITSCLSRFGATVNDIQDLLLGRVFMLGSGTLSRDNVSQTEVSPGSEETWVLRPLQKHPDIEYGFTLRPDGQMLLMAAVSADARYECSAYFDHLKNGDTDLDITIRMKNKSVPFNVTLSTPDFSPTPLSRIGINPKWSKTDFKGLLDSFK